MIALGGLGAAVVGLGVAFLVGYLIGHETGPTKTTTEVVAPRSAAPGGETVGDTVKAPAFTAEQLAADPRVVGIGECGLAQAGDTGTVPFVVRTKREQLERGDLHGQLAATAATLTPPDMATVALKPAVELT